MISILNPLSCLLLSFQYLVLFGAYSLVLSFFTFCIFMNYVEELLFLNLNGHMYGSPLCRLCT